MVPINLVFDFSDAISDGIDIFNTIFTAVTGNPIMVSVIVFGIVVSFLGLVWNTFRH